MYFYSKEIGIGSVSYLRFDDALKRDFWLNRDRTHRLPVHGDARELLDLVKVGVTWECAGSLDYMRVF